MNTYVTDADLYVTMHTGVWIILYPWEVGKSAIRLGTVPRNQRMLMPTFRDSYQCKTLTKDSILIVAQAEIMDTV